MDIQSETWPNSLQQIRITLQKQEWINSFWWSAICGREMVKCGVFIPSHSHQVIPIFISILMKLAWRFPFPWEYYGTHGNSQWMSLKKLSSRSGVGPSS